MATIKTTGIVLRRRNYGEADRILDIFTPGLGKISAIAKGSRRPKSRLAGHIEQFSLTNFLLAEGRIWYIVTSAETEEHFGLDQSLEFIESVSYLTRLTDRFVPREEQSAEIYNLLLSSLRQLSGGKVGLLLRQFEWQLMLKVGFQPELRFCSHCSGQLDSTALGLCPTTGGALCPVCLRAEPIHVPIQPNTLKILRLFERAPIQLSAKIQGNQTVNQELERVTKAFMESILESSVEPKLVH
ncbi:DNA repair protein RecO [Candidatus Berkelbacteria bacterium]|nr:DNA repair protein RecO [Candidatus Berkelbacteria bacterium]